jgi:nucleotide-binding universal stress UspA family protein
MGRIDDFKRILVVLDDSEHSARVIARASSIAVAFSSDLHLISVIEVPWTIASKEELETPELQSERKKLVDYQKKLIDEYLAGCNLNAKSHVSYGNPANEILDYADAIDADLIEDFRKTYLNQKL